MKDFFILKAFMKKITEFGPTGCACAITKHGQTVFEEYCGFADKEKIILINPDTIYRIYSMTKVITCAAALMLYERGLFLLTDPIYEYLPEFSDMQVCSNDSTGALTIQPAKKPILIKDLFCMTSGLTYNYDNSETERRMDAFFKERKDNQYNLREAMKALSRIPLAFDPGSHWKYGVSHDVLGALIEVISGKSFGQFLKNEILDPIGMKDTSFHVSDDTIHRLCGLYERTQHGELIDCPGSVHDSFDANDPYENGGAGLLCTLADYSSFLRVLACGGEKDGVRLLGRKTLELMATNHLNAQQLMDYHDTPLRTCYGYGLGVRVLTDRAACGCNGSVGEFGWGGWAGTWMMVDPKEKLSVVYMHQLRPNMSEYIQPRLRAIVNACL